MPNQLELPFGMPRRVVNTTASMRESTRYEPVPPPVAEQEPPPPEQEEK